MESSFLGSYLVDIVLKRDIETVRFLSDAVSTHFNSHNNYALNVAIRQDIEECVNILIEKKSVWESYPPENNPMIDAIRSPNPRYVDMLICARCDHNAVDGDGNNMIINAILYARSDQIVYRLIDAKFNQNIVDQTGNTALNFAIERYYNVNPERRIQLVERLIDNAADLNVVNRYGKTALMSAVKSNNHNIVKILIERSKTSNQPIDHAIIASTQIIDCMVSASTDIIQELVDIRCDINRKSRSGFTLLFYAVQTGYYERVRWLIKKKADVSIICGYKTVLDIAKERHAQHKTIELLERINAEPVDVDQYIGISRNIF
jgi:ankyrin repeat protein